MAEDGGHIIRFTYGSLTPAVLDGAESAKLFLGRQLISSWMSESLRQGHSISIPISLKSFVVKE